MTNFKLQPGDWIPTCEVPVDKRQAVIDAFEEDGCVSNDYAPTPTTYFLLWEYVGWDENDGDGYVIDFFNDDCVSFKRGRRVTLEQILGDGDVSTVEVPKEPTPEMINAMFDAMRKLEDEEYPGHMAKYSVNDMLAHVWIAGVNAAKVGGDD